MKKALKILLLLIALQLSLQSTAFAQPAVEVTAENLLYDKVSPYFGMIHVMKDGLNGCLNYDGDLIIPVEYAELFGQKGFILAISKDGSYTLFDKKGNVLMDSDTIKNALPDGFTPDPLMIGNNILGVSKHPDYKFVDFSGKDITSILPRSVQVDENANLIKIREEKTGISYFIGSSGKQVLPRENGICYMDFSGGLVLKTRINAGGDINNVTPIAFYDANGNLVCKVPDIANGANNSVEFSYTDLATILQFSEGYAAYEDKTTKLVGFIDKTGEIAIPAQFDRCVLKFENGTAGVYLPGDDSLSFIDTKGNVLFSVPSPYPWPRNNVNGLFVNYYTSDTDEPSRVVWRDMKGDIIFSSEETYKDGKLLKYAFAFGSGKPAESEAISNISIDPYSYTAIMQTTDNRYGLHDLNGNEILLAVYDEIVPLGDSEGHLLLKKDNAYIIIKSTPTPPGQTPALIDSKTAQFIQGNWKVKNFLGFQMITKDDIEYPDGEKILGKKVIIAPGLFSTKDFAPEYEKYVEDLWRGHYNIVDELSGAEFYSAYKVGQDVTKTNDSDKVIVIQAESEDGSLSGPLLIDINHERLLLYLNCSYFELGKNFWTENDMDVAIYDAIVRNDGYYHVEYNTNAAELIPGNEQIYLLMINGGFVPFPEIKIVNNRALVPVKIISELPRIEVKQDNKDLTITITYGETKIGLTVNSYQADTGDAMKELEAAPTIINGETYIPIRFVSEALGADVEYITDLSNGGSAIYGSKKGAVSVISIEMREQPEKAYSPEEGLVKVKEASAAEYQNLLEYYKSMDREFDDAYNKDYDSQDIVFTGDVYGRYYVYRLKAFPDYNIFFNKYTGEIFSEHAGLPFLFISKGFINIPWMYQ